MDRPKTSAYAKHHDISGHLFVGGTISPKHWYPVFVTQINSTILKTSDKANYRSQTFSDSFPSPFPRLWNRFADLRLRLHWLQFLEHSNRPVDVKGLVPPEDIYHEVHSRIRNRDDFEMGDWKVFDGSCNTLHHEPSCLEKDKGFSEPVALSPVLDFRLGRHGEWLGVSIRLPKIILL